MKTVFNAFYIALFISFARKIFSKVMVSIEHEIPVKSTDDSGEYYVLVNGQHFVWEESRGDALSWCFNAITRCRSLSGKLSLEENCGEFPLFSAEGIPGLSPDEIYALNSTVDEMK